MFFLGRADGSREMVGPFLISHEKDSCLPVTVRSDRRSANTKGVVKTQSSAC